MAPPSPPNAYRTHTRTVYRPPPDVVYTSPDVVYTSPSTVYAAPPSATDAAFHDGLWAGRVEAVALAGGAYYLYEGHTKPSREEEEGADAYGEELYEEELSATRDLMHDLKAEFDAADPLVSRIQVPPSGTYAGGSAEDDGGDQGVLTHLQFASDGSVRGWGTDVEDGAYAIDEGRWSTSADATGGARVAWIERYDDGFEVALRGQVRKSDGAILGMWASSRGVSGSVELEKEA